MGAKKGESLPAATVAGGGASKGTKITTKARGKEQAEMKGGAQVNGVAGGSGSGGVVSPGTIAITMTDQMKLSASLPSPAPVSPSSSSSSSSSSTSSSSTELVPRRHVVGFMGDGVNDAGEQTLFCSLFPRLLPLSLTLLFLALLVAPCSLLFLTASSFPPLRHVVGFMGDGVNAAGEQTFSSLSSILLLVW